MKTYIFNLIHQVKDFSQRLENNGNLMNFHWVMVDDSNVKKVFIFRNNQELLISENGKVERAKWENLGNNSFLLDFNEGTFLFKQEFLDETILALKLDSENQYALFINETKFGEELNSLSDLEKFLTDKYIYKLQNLKNEIEERFIKTHFTIRLGSYDEYLFTFKNSHEVPVYKFNFSGKYFIKRHGKLKEFTEKGECVRFIEAYVI